MSKLISVNAFVMEVNGLKIRSNDRSLRDGRLPQWNLIDGADYRKSTSNSYTNVLL